MSCCQHVVQKLLLSSLSWMRLALKLRVFAFLRLRGTELSFLQLKRRYLSLQYKLYRNVVNRERKVCKANFYKLKVENMKEKNPRVWWKEVKRLCGAQQHSSDLISQIHAHDVQELSPNDLANAINDALLEPLQEYRLHQPLTRLPTDEISSKFPDTSELRIHKLLSKLNPSKASDPDLIGYYVSTLTSSLIQLVR